MRESDLMMGERPFREMTARHLMEQTVTYFKKETKCRVILSVMVNGNFGSVPIIDDEKKLIGIVSEYDLLDALLTGIDLASLSAGEIMKYPHAVSIDATANEIGRFLQKNHLIRVPVVDREGRLVGIVARRDLLNGYLEALLGPDENGC